MKRVKEDEIQKWLEKKENYENFIDIIKDSEILKNNNSNNVIPIYSLDYIVKNKILKSAEYVYNNLYNLELVVANKNISITKQERLFPDLLLFNAETSTFIIVEIKRSDKAEREAITEILAYEHELQNLFPFMSKLEVCFVLISADYKPLLEHSLYSLALWQNRKILPLKISGIENKDSNKWNLSIHIPNSWSLLSTGYLKPEQIDTVQLVLYDKDAYNHDIDIKTKEDNLALIQRGIELIVKEGEKNHSSGFVLLSRFTHSPLTNWGITIGVVNPYSFVQLLEYESKIKDFFDKEYDYELKTQCTMYLASNAQKYLNIFYDSQFETFNTWDSTKMELQEISEPILIDFFGEIDDMVNDFVLNEYVRKYYFNELNSNKVSWKDPIIGLNLLDNLLGDNIFFDGNFNYINIYKFGKIVGTLIQYLYILENNKSFERMEHLVGKYRWIELEFMKSYREVYTRYLETENITSIFIPFKSLSEDININIQNIESIIDWFLKEFISDSLNNNSFTLGLRIKNYFYDKKNYMAKEEVISIENLIIDTTKNMINIEFENSEAVEFFDVNSELEKYKKEFNLNKNYDFSKLDRNIIIEKFEEYTIKLFSKIIQPVIHSKSPIQSSNFDFSFLKETYPIEYEKSEKNIVKLSPNGNLGITKVPIEMEMYLTVFGKINPKKELFFWNDKHGNFKIINKLSWEDFENMEF